MRIIHVIGHGSSQGGQQTYALTLCQALQARGHEVCLVAPPGDIDAACAHNSVAFVPLAVNPRLRPASVLRVPLYLEAVVRLSRLCRASRNTVLHAHGPSSSVYLACLAARLVRVPLVLTMHGRFHLGIGHRWALALFGRQLRTATTLTAISEETAKFVRQRWLGQDLEVAILRNPIAWTYPSCRVPGPESSDTAQRIVHVSRQTEDKIAATLLLIKAMAEILKRLPGAKLYVIGDGPQLTRSRKEAALVNGPAGRTAVFTLGGLTTTKVLHVYAHADIAVGVGRGALEAMACGIPTLALSAGGYGGLVTSANWERLSKSNFSGRSETPLPAPEALAREILEVLTSACRWKEGQRGAQAAAGAFSVETVVSQAQALYANAVSKIEPPSST